MNNSFKIYLTAILFFVSTVAIAQFNSNYICKKVKAISGLIDESKNIVQGSFTITALDKNAYSFNYTTKYLTFLSNVNFDSVQICYRVFNFSINTKAYRYNYDSVRDKFIAQPAYSNKIVTNNSMGFFGNNSLNYNGSFGRNISFGNNQNAIFNSQLNLQISGYLTDSIQLMAAITDNNIPIQPDGTTQQLNEFDRILLQFKKLNWQLSLGDIDIRKPEYYFLNFYKRLQGVSYEQKNYKSNLSVAGAVAKGKFVRMIFQGQESNQGPYRLQGNNNELFIIVLAGTERVFIDGLMLQRGEDQDYIINYNTGEIVFTQKQMITKDKRIQVEFEYADRNYLNAMLFASYDYNFSKNTTLSVAAYSNNDAKNSSINQTLDEQQKQFLAGIGDSLQKAFYTAAVRDTFSAGKILYEKVPNPTNPLIDSIFVYSTNANAILYNVNFIQVGNNKGNYILLNNAVNGKVFQYTPAVNGILQGNYEPAIFLITPKKIQIITGVIISVINKTSIIETNLAVSNYDANTFSLKDKTDNTGFAGKIKLTNNYALRNAATLAVNADYEYVDKNYRPLERLRNVEFYRDWGLSLLPNFATEHLPKVFIQYNTNNLTRTSLAYNAELYNRSDGFNGFRNRFIVQNNFVKGKLKYLVDASVSANNSNETKGAFTKVIAEIEQPFSFKKQYSIGANYLLEHNNQLLKQFDSLNIFSYAFSQIGAYIKSNMAADNKWSINYFTRKDWLPGREKLVAVDQSHNFNYNLELMSSLKHQFKLNATYRILEIYNNSLTNLNADKSLLGRAEYYINEWNGFINGNIFYELGTGQEQKRFFSFIEVPAGRGEYTWNDYNNDGIAQLNEFEIALFPDQAKYIRIITPTNEFVKAGYVQFNYALNILPRAIIKNKATKLNKIFSNIMFNAAMQANYKSITNGTFIFNPFQTNLADTALISSQFNTNNTLSYNRQSSIWGFDITHITLANKALFTYGFESREQKELITRVRVNVKKQYTIELINKWGSNNLKTPAFDNRNFSINSFSIEPKISYTYLTKFRLQTGYQFSKKNNKEMYGGEEAINNIIMAEAKYNAVNATSLLARLTLNNINYTGSNASTISYIMLDALVPGKNYLWNLELTKRLGNNLELNISYEGRKPGDNKTIHIGRAGIRAIL